jgi:hypothetical protein
MCQVKLLLFLNVFNKLNLIQQFDMQTRALGACGYVLVSSFLIRENILALVSILLYSTLRVGKTKNQVIHQLLLNFR